MEGLPLLMVPEKAVQDGSSEGPTGKWTCGGKTCCSFSNKEVNLLKKKNVKEAEHDGVLD